jgi:hypothetical protein
MVTPPEEGKVQEPTQPEGEPGKPPKKVLHVHVGKKFLIFLGLGCVIAAVVVGVGFIPKTVYYACTTTEYSDCYQEEDYACQEAYTCYEDEAYTTTSTVHLTYTYVSYSSDTDFSGDINVYCNIRNTDTTGGYFTVNFEATVEGMTGTKTATQWISAGDLGTVAVQFARSWLQDWSYEVPVVTAPTKTVQGVGTHSVAHTCYRADTCQRDVLVPNGCSQDVSSTCSYQDKLFW